MRATRTMSWLVAVTLAAGLAGCGGAQTAKDPTRIELLRRRAADNPHDPQVQRALAEAELLADDGDPARAEAQIERALALAPDDPALRLAAALERNLHGDQRTALDQALAALERARRSDAPEAPLVAEVAVGLLSDLIDAVPGSADAVREGLEPLTRDAGRAGPAARALASGVLFGLHFRRGDVEAARTLSEALGCVPTWRVAGPFGPRELLDFDRRHAALSRGPLADAYDLGPDRGVQPTRSLDTQACQVQLGAESPVKEGGTTYAEAFVEVPADEAGEHVLRLETPNAAEVYLDGRRVVRLDARREPTPRVTYHRLDVPAGRHEVTVKIGSRHPSPALDLALWPTSMPPAFEGDSPLGRYLRAASAFSRGDVVGARETLRPAVRDGRGSPLVLLLAASVTLSDDLRPGDVRRDEARRLLAAAKRDREAWLPELQIARLAAADGQAVAAIERLRKAVDAWPKVLVLRLALEDLLLDRGWEAEAYEVAEAAHGLVPDACPAIRVALDAAGRRDDVSRARKLIEDLVDCDARTHARLEDLVDRRRWDDAAAELERLARLEPPQRETRILFRELRLARGRGDRAEAQRLIQALADREPRAASLPLAIADHHQAEGRTREALTVLNAAIERDPESMAELRWVRHMLGGEDEIDRWRVDGEKVLQEFEASGRTYDAPQVLVWDYMATRVFEDGSRFELVHQIHKVQSKEAVDDEGEFREPEGARLLTLHTIKPDGTRLEPDAIHGKDTISLPDLTPGDYVEHEYVRFESPPGGMPGAVLGDRFFFRNFETPFDRSEMAVIVPEDHPITVDPRGPAPEARERVHDGLREYRWEVTESRPLTREPMSVAPQEWIPSIAWGIGAEWELLVGGLLDALVDKDVADPQARRLARKLAGDAQDDVTRARRLYAWVLEHVEDADSVFEQAAPMLAQRTGDRNRVLRYLLGLVGVESELVLARSIASDQTDAKVANDQTFTNLLVRVAPEDHEPVFLSLKERGAPFGYVPPGLRGQEALVLAPGAPRVTLPEGASGQDRHTAEMSLALGTDGSARAKMVEVYRGAGAVAWRNNLEGVPDAVLQERFGKQYVARLIPGARLTELEIEGRDDPELPFVLRYAFEVSNLGRRQGNRWILPTLLPPRFASRYASAAKRTTTQVVAPPFEQHFTLRVDVPGSVALPPSWKPVRLAGPGGARFAMRAARDGDTLVVERKARIPLQRVSADGYPKWAAFCRAADQVASREIPLTLE